MSSCSDPDLENSKSIFLHDTPPHSDARQYLFGDLEDIIWTNMNILTLCYDRDPECSNQFFSQDTLAYNVKSSDQVWLPRNQQFRKKQQKESYLDHTSPCCDPDLDDSTHKKMSFCMTDTLAHDAASPYQIW